MSTGLPAAPKGGMNLRNAASRSAGIGHQLQAVVDAGVGQQHAGAAGAGDDDHVLALGRGQHRHAARKVEQVAQAPRADHAATAAARRRRSCRCRPVRRCASWRPRAPVAVRPALSTITGFFFETRLATSAKARPSFRSSQCCAITLRVRVLLEESSRSSSSMSDLLPRPDDRRDAHLRRAGEADDRHADAARLRRQGRVALHVVGRAEGGAQVGRRVVEAVDVRPHQADVVLAADR